MKNIVVVVLLLITQVSVAQNLKISQLPVANIPLGGTELVPVVQDGVTKQTTAAAIGNTFTGSGFVTGTGTANQIAYWNGTGTIIGDTKFTRSSTGLSLTDGRDDVFIGVGAGSTSATSYNIGIGTNALHNSLGGLNDIAIGYNALQNLTSPTDDIAIGSGALASDVSVADKSIAIGSNALGALTDGSHNIAIGYGSNQLSVNAYGVVTLGDNISVTGSSVFHAVGLGMGATITGNGQLMVDPNINTLGFNGVNYVFPNVQGAASTVLTNDGSGNLTWTSPGGGSSLTANYIGYGSSGNTLTGSGAMVFYPANSINGNQFLMYSNDLSQIVFGAAIYGATGSAPATVLLNAPNIITNGVMYHYPSTQGAASTVLTNDGSGNLTWASAGGGSAPVYPVGYIPYGDGSTAGGTTSVNLLFTGGGSGTAKTFEVGDPNNSGAVIFSVAGVGIAGRQTIFEYPKITIGTPTYVFPSSQGSAGTVLTNDGSGNLSWASAGGGGGGSSSLTSTYIGYGDGSNLLTGDADFVRSSYGIGIEDNTTSQNIFIGVPGFPAGSNSCSGTITNIGIGRSSLESLTSGNANVAVGYQSMVANTTGLANVGVGLESLINNTTGQSNIGIGRFALSTNQTGSDLIGIGENADVSVDGFSNSIAIGHSATITSSNQFIVAAAIINWNIGGVSYVLPSSQGNASTVLTNDGSGNLSWKDPAPYTEYDALLNQSGATAPIPTIIYNNTGGTISFARTGLGTYTATISGVSFTSNKTVVFITGGINSGQPSAISAILTSTSVITIYTGDFNAFSLDDGDLSNSPIKIQIFQ